MRQSRRMSLIEAATNVAVGYALAVATQIVVFPWFGLQASLGENLRWAGSSPAYRLIAVTRCADCSNAGGIPLTPSACRPCRCERYRQKSARDAGHACAFSTGRRAQLRQASQLDEALALRRKASCVLFSPSS